MRWIDLISVVMQLWWLHRPQQRIMFFSSFDGWKDDDWWNVPSVCCLKILAHLFFFSKKGGETEDEKPRDTFCREAWIRPQGETESKEMEWWRTQQQEEEEEKRHWDVPLHQWEQGERSAAGVRVLLFGSNWCNGCYIEVLFNFTLLTSYRCHSPLQTDIYCPGATFLNQKRRCIFGECLNRFYLARTVWQACLHCSVGQDVLRQIYTHLKDCLVWTCSCN